MLRSISLGLMAKNENDLDISYPVVNSITSKQENEIGEIIKKEIHCDGNYFLPLPKEGIHTIYQLAIFYHF